MLWNMSSIDVRIDVSVALESYDVSAEFAPVLECACVLLCLVYPYYNPFSPTNTVRSADRHIEAFDGF